MSGLVERLRAPEHWAIERSEAELKREAADLIEAQAVRIAELEAAQAGVWNEAIEAAAKASSSCMFVEQALGKIHKLTKSNLYERPSE